MSKKPDKFEKIENELLEYVYKHPILNYFHKWGHIQAEKYLGNSENSLVLDLGCGRGDHLRFSTIKRKYIGIDNSFIKLKFAIKNYNYCFTITADAIHLPFKNNSFNFIISIYNLEHIKNLKEAIKEIFRILKPEGKFIVLLPTESLLFKIGRFFTSKRYAEKKYNINYIKMVEEEHINSLDSIINILEENFHIEKIKSHPFPLFLNFANISIALKLKKKNL